MKTLVRRKKVLGIIGGMGPIADVTFLKLLHSHTVAETDFDHVPVIYDGNCTRPDRSNALIGISRKSPYESLRLSLKHLERSGAEVIVIPCNTAHFWISKLMRRKKRTVKLIDMIYEVCKACQRVGLGKVCLLCTQGTRKKKLYEEAAFRMGFDIVYPDYGVQKKISALISSVKRGEPSTLSELEADLKDITCDGFILGCTELSVALDRTREPLFTYIDSLSVLAEKAIKECGGRAKPFEYA